MSVLSDNVQDLTMDCFYKNGTIAWGDADGLSRPGIEIKLIEAFYACDPNKWISQFENSVKSLLNAQKVHINMDDHPFASDIKQVWIHYDGRICTLYVTKKGQPGDTELAAYVANDVLFTQPLKAMHSQLQAKQGQPTLPDHS